MSIEELVRELIQIKSVDKEGANTAVEFCSAWLKQAGVETLIIENNGFKSLIAEAGSGTKTLILNGHVDVVSGKPQQFEPLLRDGRLYGRGAADMKAGVAVFLTVMAKLKENPPQCRVQLQIVSDEETGGANCSNFLAHSGYIGDFVVCGEPTQLGLGIQAKGILQLDITVDGKSAHGSRPWEGENAIEKAVLLYGRILQLPFTEERTELYEKPSINFAKISAGEAYNKVPDKCRFSLDIRYLPTQDPEKIFEQIQVLGVKPEIHAAGNPVTTDPDDLYVVELGRVVSKITQSQPRIFGQHGSADTRFYSRLGIPAIEFGPCGGEWHGDGEYADIASIRLYEEILCEFIKVFPRVEKGR